MGHNRSNAAASRSSATDAPRSEKCMNCNPLWDRQGNVKAIQLCNFHSKMKPLLAAAKKAEKMIYGLLDGFAPSPEEVAEFRDVVAHSTPNRKGE